MSIETFEKFRVMAIKAGGVFTALFMSANYFSTALGVILSAILGLLWMLSSQFMALPGLLKKSPVALWSLILYGGFVVGLSYGQIEGREAFAMLSKYRELFFIPILISFLRKKRYRYWAWNAFIVASGVTLLISYLMDFGILSLNNLGSPCFKSRITHGIFMAFFAFFCIHQAFDPKRYAKLYLILLVLCLYNLFFVVDSLTGQIIVVALMALFAIQRLSAKKCMLAVLVVTVLLGLFVNFSDKAGRITGSFSAYSQPGATQTDVSMGLRYTFWKYSLKLMAEKPFFGHGTGSFAGEYQRISSGESVFTRNPHNEFLMIGVQLGALGILIYSGFFISQYYCAKKLPNAEKCLAQGILLSLFIASLFNTPFLDHTEGHWFAIMLALCFAAYAEKPGNGEELL